MAADSTACVAVVVMLFIRSLSSSVSALLPLCMRRPIGAEESPVCAAESPLGGSDVVESAVGATGTEHLSSVIDVSGPLVFLRVWPTFVASAQLTIVTFVSDLVLFDCVRCASCASGLAACVAADSTACAAVVVMLFICSLSSSVSAMLSLCVRRPIGAVESPVCAAESPLGGPDVMESPELT